VPLIAIEGLHKSFGANEVLKSTLLRCMNGLEAYQGGRITVDGTPVTQAERDLRQLRLKVGMIFQQFNLFPHLNAGRNVMLAPMIVKGTGEGDARAIAEKVLARVGLGEKFSAYPDQLSGGQQQRVAIARALAMEPRALLCDEITSALDPELVNEVLQVVKGLASDGMTLAMVTHEMRFARDVCDRVIFMHQGKVHEMGPPADVFSKPKTPELQQFLGQLE
jgi:polar amino acid transport system ATP-binding protein